MSRPFLIPKLIRILMVDNDLRISDLARLCDTCERNIYFVLQGERKKPKYHTILAKALGIPEEAFSALIPDFKQSKQLPRKGPMVRKVSEA
jgi:hypothetical protein